MLESKPNMPDDQQLAPIPQNYEGMLPSRPSSAIGKNIYGDIWTSHKSLGSVQGLEVKLDEHKKVANMFQYAT